MHASVLLANAGLLVAGLVVTIEVSVAGWILALAVGIVIAIARVIPVRVCRVVATAYVEFFRNVPLLVQIFFLYFALPSAGIRLSGFASATIGLGIYTAAFIAEALRGGIGAVGRGQLEAAESSGLTYVQAMRTVVLPQAFRIALPPLANQTLNLVKNSSLASTVSVFDILKTTQQLGAQTFLYSETLAAAAVLYAMITIPTAWGANALERRLRAR